MKLFDFALAPNPKKVRVYLKEKGIELPLEAVDVPGGQNRTPEFLAKVNPLGGLPVGLRSPASSRRPIHS